LTKLLSTLEAQHRALERIAGEVEEALKAGEPGLVADRVRRLRTTLEVHLALEKAQFYPAFETGKAETQASAGVARMFSQNMKLIAEGLTGFFTRYSQAPTDLVRFEREWRATVGVLSSRISAEEKTLHPMYEALQN
jgi:hypothetical protein